VNRESENVNAIAEHEWRDGWLVKARRLESPNRDSRPDGAAIDVVVLHHISLPEGVFGGDAVERLFLNRISADEPDLGELASLRVSAHFFLRRDGELIQFVSVSERAWHAGVSSWRGRERCNDFSVGIEIEGDSEHGFTSAQYGVLNPLLRSLNATFGVNALTTHAEIAFGRKIDPGSQFDFSLIAEGDRI
jgi:N-acetyl-anhydromuramoyl-L-alanine amidase